MKIKIGILLLFMILFDGLSGYPIDGYQWTGIRRLLKLSMISEGQIKGTLPPPGGRKPYAEIALNLLNARGDSLDALPKVDPELQKRIDALFPNRDESYSLALLEITPGKPTRFAKRQADNRFAPGSVGKLAILAGLFTELQKIYPVSPEKRRELLRTRMVVADKWILTDHHDVPFFNPETKASFWRPIKEGDTFSLYEWVDHMISASANSAASVVWKEVLLMRAFGKNYPASAEWEKHFFEKTSKSELSAIAMSTVNDPLRVMGIEQNEWQLGSFFTQTGKKLVPGGGGSYGTPTALLKYLIALERGKIVDEWSSLEIKRMMYMTAKRIRYASSPALTDAAVYFKSGSQYRCKVEPDFKCGKYMGNVENYMNSVAIVEHPAGRVYLVALMSNVLKKNSAVEHQSLATFIDRIISK
ncbi:MAG: serine hydrolase [Calditrichaceae bacterium]